MTIARRSQNDPTSGGGGDGRQHRPQLLKLLPERFQTFTGRHQPLNVVTQFFTGTLLTFTGTAFRPVPASLHVYHWMHGLKVQDRQVTNLCLDVTAICIAAFGARKTYCIMRVGYIGTK
jgi:hypothetical protein